MHSRSHLRSAATLQLQFFFLLQRAHAGRHDFSLESWRLDVDYINEIAHAVRGQCTWHWQRCICNQRLAGGSTASRAPA